MESEALYSTSKNKIRLRSIHKVIEVIKVAFSFHKFLTIIKLLYKRKRASKRPSICSKRLLL